MRPVVRIPDLLTRRHVTVATLSVSAGAVHIAASGTHRDLGLLFVLLAICGLGQLALGVSILVVPGRPGILAVAAFNGIAVLAWLASRTVGLPLAGAAGSVQPFGTQDVVAALLGAGAMTTGIRAVRRPTDDRAAFGYVTAAAVVSLTLMGIAAPHDHGVIDQSVPILEAGRLSARMPQDEAIALLGLAARPPLSGASGSQHHHGGNHGQGFEEPPAPRPLSDAESARFEEEWAQALAAAESLSTMGQALSAGYTQASTEAPGIGSHWVKWSLVDQPFDPAKPSMVLLKQMRHGEDPELVGFSYLVASPDEPEGFAGPNDVWHQHHGMCFIDGWLRGEDVEARGDCADTWVDGSDLWMLHAWVSSPWSNRWGLFADMNPALCGRKPLTPDIVQCDPEGI